MIIRAGDRAHGLPKHEIYSAPARRQRVLMSPPGKGGREKGGKRWGWDSGWGWDSDSVASGLDMPRARFRRSRFRY